MQDLMISKQTDLYLSQIELFKPHIIAALGAIAFAATLILKDKNGVGILLLAFSLIHLGLMTSLLYGSISRLINAHKMIST